MSRRRLAAAAWLGAGLITSLTLALTVISVGSAKPGDTLGALWPASWLGFPIVGAVIASRRPRNPIGWLLIAIGGCVVIGVSGDAYAQGTVQHGWPAGDWVLLATQPLFTTGFVLLPFLVLLFPSGRLPSPRWRIPCRLMAADIGLLLFAYAFRGTVEAGEGIRLHNPIAIGPIATSLNAILPGFVLVAVAFAIAVVAHTVWRFVRSKGTDRQQTKWFVFAAASFPVLFGSGLASGRYATLSTLFIMSAFLLGLNGVAAAIGIAVLRYRLYDIDRIVTRTLTYGLVTALLLGGYVGLVVVFQAVTRPVTGRSDLAVAGSTLIVAALFVPLRRRVQSAIDHRFNRARYDAEQTIDAFATRLRDEVDISTLSQDLEAVVRQTMQPVHVSVWIAGPPTGERTRA
jgi:hypothetical protein